MKDEFVNGEPETGSGGLRSFQMKRSMASKPVEGSEPRVGLWSGSVSVSCPRGRTLPQYRLTRRRRRVQKSLHWRETDVVNYGVVQKRLVPSPSYLARKMGNKTTV